jgi:hypothetical protein
VKLHAVLNLYNDRTFVAAMLESIKDVVDSIIVVDGAYTQYLEQFKEFVPLAKPWSTDGSIEVIRAMPDLPPVKFYAALDGKCWENQVVKRNFCINQVPENDAFLIIDADEMLMGDAQEAIEAFYDSGCLAMQMPLYTPGLQQDRVVPRWHPRLFLKRPGMHYKGTHWHLRDKAGRIVEEKYPMFFTDLAALVHMKSFKDNSRLIPHQNYMIKLAERGWTEITPGQAPKKEGEKKPWIEENKP